MCNHTFETETREKIGVYIQTYITRAYRAAAGGDLKVLAGRIPVLDTRTKEAAMEEWQSRWDRECGERWLHELIPNLKLWTDRNHVSHSMVQIIRDTSVLGPT